MSAAGNSYLHKHRSPAVDLDQAAYEVFHDGQTLVIIFPRLMDIQGYTQLYGELQASKEFVDNFLLDFSTVESIVESGTAVLLTITNLARRSDIRLLGLQSSRSVMGRIATILPEVAWVG